MLDLAKIGQWSNLFSLSKPLAGHEFRAKFLALPKKGKKKCQNLPKK
jgi:hypothetical protein